jgi:lipopolysaccharide biosynthesis glycosyltransferase
MKRLIYTTAVNTQGRTVKDTEIFSIARNTWEHYCKRYDIDFFVIDEPQHPNTSPHWYRYWIFDLKPDYDQYLYVDTDVFAHWNAPNIFDTFPPGKFYAAKDDGGLSWIWEGIQGYQTMFPDTKLEWDEYFNSGVLLFDRSHKEIMNVFKSFYIENQSIIQDYREKFRKGHDQNIFNYFLRYAEVEVELISHKWNLFHMIRREILYNGYFLDMGYFWHFNNLDRNIQQQLLQNIWNKIKNRYD